MTLYEYVIQKECSKVSLTIPLKNSMVTLVVYHFALKGMLSYSASILFLH